MTLKPSCFFTRIDRGRRSRYKCLNAYPRGNPMQTAKKEINKLLRRLPENCSMEDIQYHIYVLQKIERGLQQADDGKVISAEVLEKRMKMRI